MDRSSDLRSDSGERVRRLTPADAAAAGALIREAFAAQDYATEPPSSALKETTESVAKAIAADGGFAVERDGVLVALALVERRPGALYVRRLSVRPDVRGGGLGRRLILALEQEARALGLGALEAQVRLALTGNRAFFARLGFEEVGQGRHAGFDAPTFVIVRKALRP